MEFVFGIDVGGTSIKVGLFTPQGELLEERRIPTPALDNPDAYAVVTEGLGRILESHDAAPADVVACGIDIPGPVADDGTVGFLPNIQLDPDGFTGAVNAYLPSASVAVLNDANAAAVGEMWMGSARGIDNFCLIALGTGVGAGVVCGGRLVAGAFGNGGELGHVTVRRDEERTCGCGRHGCLEQYASATGVVYLYQRECERHGVTPVHLDGPTDTLSVFQALGAGDECARLAVHEMCDYLAFAMAQVSCVVDPEVFLIGGGVAGAFPTFAPTLRELYHGYALKSCKDTRIEAASLGNQAAMYGSAYQAMLKRAQD